MKTITFIKPNIGRKGHSLYIDEGRMEPLMLGILAGLTPPGIGCVLYDDRMEAIPFDEPTDLVAINVDIFTARRAYEISAEYRARGVPVILGGIHVGMCPEEALAHADSIFIGDAEFGWDHVVRDLEQGRIQRIYHFHPGSPQPGGILPRRSIFSKKGYLPLSLVQFSRGCPHSCDFCAVSAYFRQHHYTRPVKDVLLEIEQANQKYVFFVDDNLLANVDDAKKLLRALIPMRIRWISQASIDMTADPELMDLVEASGCLGNVIGFETLNTENLRSSRKSPNLSGDLSNLYSEQLEILRAHHLQTWGAFTLGYDADTTQSIWETHQFAMAHKLAFAAYNILMPYPGTDFYRKLALENRLLYDGCWWLHPNYRFNHAAYIPRNMTPDELTAAVWRCRQDWNSISSIFRRMWDIKTHLHSPLRLGIYWAYNRLYAREAIKKQGLGLGFSMAAPSSESESRNPDSLPSILMAGGSEK